MRARRGGVSLFGLLHGLRGNDVLLKDPVGLLWINLCVWQVATAEWAHRERLVA